MAIEYRECSNCIFMLSALAGDGDKRPQCRRNPPGEFGHTFTQPDWWCGEWQCHPDVPNGGLEVGTVPRLDRLNDK